MQEDRFAWAILIAVVSALFPWKNTMLRYVTSGIIVLLLFAVLVLKPRQPMAEARGAFSLTMLSTPLMIHLPKLLEGILLKLKVRFCPFSWPRKGELIVT